MAEDGQAGAAARIRKRLVVCFDGTWNAADNVGAFTNVARISRAIHATTGTGDVLQSVVYLRGVGTGGLDITRTFDGATGLGIDDNIRSGYMFIAQNYVPGDEIMLFGFSRGAFTARSLVGLISATGLLRRQSLGNLGRAWLYYRNEARPHTPEAFMRYEPQAQVHTDVSIAFLGVWDTVGALGIPGHLFDRIDHDLYGFYDTGLCPIVHRAAHALAADEHRSAFVPTFWTGEAPAGCHVEQVWFAGAHADVGGGYRQNRLADIPLVWMARQAEAAGLVLDWSCLPDPRDADPLAPRHDSSAGAFLFNRVVPTIRQVCGQHVDVPFYQTLYAPTDARHHLLPVVNEAVHASVVARYGKAALRCTDDGDGAGKPPHFADETYAPANVRALFDDAGGLKPGIAVADESAA